MRPRAKLTSAAPLFAALGDEARLRIVSRLHSGQLLSISTLTDGSGITRQAVTKHLGVMSKAGLVTCTRRGRESLWMLQDRPWTRRGNAWTSSRSNGMMRWVGCAISSRTEPPAGAAKQHQHEDPTEGERNSVRRPRDLVLSQNSEPFGHPVPRRVYDQRRHEDYADSLLHDTPEQDSQQRNQDRQNRKLT